ncbi:MAG: hypothetical protein HY315_06915 [Acidobacteria bacterium]|nr:hypothetical protein [Acidobacteriota bacterium]
MPKNTKLRDLMEEMATEMVEKGIFWHEAVMQFEKHFIQTALRRSEGNLLKTAAAMGIHRNTLSKKITQHRISKENPRPPSS